MPRISPDGRRVALQLSDQESDIWIWDFDRQTLTRLTFDPGEEQLPVWTPDSRRIIFNSTRSGLRNLYWQMADGTGSAERLTTSTNNQFPFSISPDGTRVLIGEVDPKTAADVRVLVMPGQRQTEPLVQTGFAEYSPEISPDGGWVAYQSNESGPFEIYVRPFPNTDAGRWQVSTAGGTRPLWARNGHELFYLDNNGLLTAVSVQTVGPTFSSGIPTKVFEAPYYSGFNLGAYDISPDGRRFLMIKASRPSDDPTFNGTSPSLIVVLNWLEELKQRVPTK
jgi:eukaryotic-like serine/threonine-protein kinase